MSGSHRSDSSDPGLGLPPSTAPPPSVRAAILARVVEQTVGGGETPLLDGRYRLLQEIGRGGAGTVWKAELLPLGRLVAVKLLRPGVGTHGNAVSRLMREAMTVSKLGHEHIVQVNDVGTDEHGSPYIAMELLQGESLAQVVARRGRLPWSAVAEIATQLCDALSAAHAVGIVHRDVKPANVVAAKREDRSWRCKLLDFGLCTAGRGASALTAAGVLLGTPGYAAPEQVRGERVDGRADLYGLACVMVELLTGRPAFRGNSRQEVVAQQLEGRRAGDLDALDLPAGVVELIDRGLSVSADERHDDPAAFAEALCRAGRHKPPPTPRLDTASPTTLGTLRLVGGAVTLACAGAAAVALWSIQSEPAASMAASTAPVVSPVPSRDIPSSASASAPIMGPPTHPADRTAVAPAPVPEELPAVAAASPHRKQPARRKASKPKPKPKPTTVPEPRTSKPPAPRTPAPRGRESYPDGIRDPFAVR